MGDGSIPSAFFSFPGDLFQPEVTPCCPGDPSSSWKHSSYQARDVVVGAESRVRHPCWAAVITEAISSCQLSTLPLTSLSCPQGRATMATPSAWGPAAGHGAAGAGAARQRAMIPVAEPSISGLGGRRGPGGLSSP